MAIAEEHGIAMAAGMAKAFMKPVFATKSSFFKGRMTRFLRKSVLIICQLQ